VFSRILLFALLATTPACLVTRGSPQISGTILDAVTGAPLADVEIRDGPRIITDEPLPADVIARDGAEVITTTDTSGHFEIERTTYREFTWFGREAPPLLINFALVKDGYEPKHVQSFAPHGGGSSEGTLTPAVHGPH
jgi:hypothetical protein